MPARHDTMQLGKGPRAVSLLLASACAVGAARPQATETFRGNGPGSACRDSWGARKAGLDGATVTWIWIDPLRAQVRFAACDRRLS